MLFTPRHDFFSLDAGALSGRFEEAEATLQNAAEFAQKQGAKSWELRAAIALARFHRDQSQIERAVDVLQPVYDWFTEGFDTRDLKTAQALLSDLKRSIPIRP